MFRMPREQEESLGSLACMFREGEVEKRSRSAVHVCARFVIRHRQWQRENAGLLNCRCAWGRSDH